MKSNRQELTKSCKDLLEFSVGDLIPMLSKKTKLLHVRQKAFDWYDPKTKETYQVLVTVSRDNSDWLEDFQTEEMSGYEPKTQTP